MKEYLKNPNLYYIAVPVAAAVWVIFVAVFSLPAANRKWQNRQKEYNEARDWITKIVMLDPERLNYKKKTDSSGGFDYSTAVEEITRLVGIASSNYSLRGGRTVKSGGKMRKSADIVIEPVDIETLSRFLSQILLRWPDLQCDRLSIDKLPAGKDSWKASMKFIYTYQ